MSPENFNFENIENDKEKTEEFSAGEWLGKKYPDLRKSKEIELSHEYSEKKEKNKVDTWLKNMESFHQRHRDNPIEMDLIKDALHEEYVIKPENVPESYFENQQRLAREQGYGNIEITDELKSQGIDVVISDQKSTLDNWSEYIFSKDSDVYPMWAKYWAFQSMTKLSSYDKEKKSFGTRRKDTVAPFPDLNREALAYVVDAINKKAHKDNIGLQENNPELQKLINSENFGKLYAYAIEKVTPTEINELIITEGEWRKYDQGSDYIPLVKSLQGHGTGWCTAGESTAETQLKGGDFYVYYSKDKDGKYTIPRTAIRMQENQIGEVRGIAPNQNLDPYINKVVDEKLSQFPDGKRYKKKVEDMKLLTEIEKKQSKNEELTEEELRFLYEFDTYIHGFGYQQDPRINEIIEKRNIKSDLSLLTGFSREEIGITKEESLNSNIKFYWGDLVLYDIKSAEGLKLPETIKEDLDLHNLQSAKGLTFPKKIGGNLHLYNLQSAEGLNLPQRIGRNLYLTSLQSAKGLKLPKDIGGGIAFSSLQSAEGLELPEGIGDIELQSLRSAEGLKFPKSMEGGLDLSNLRYIEGLNLPENLRGALLLKKIKSAEGLKFPEGITELNLENLESTKGLNLPKKIGGDIYLNNLKSAEGLKLPEDIEGSIELRNLQSAKGIKFPENIKGALNLESLESAEGLELPENIEGYLSLVNLKSQEGLNLPKKIGGDIYLQNLQSAKGLKFPDSLGKNIYLNHLESAEGLELPENIEGNIYLGNLQSIEKEIIKQRYPKLKII